MTSGVTIGEFSRLCHLSAKTLRYYHDIELLVPAAVDANTGYRRYSTDQVGDAHLIRRLRDLDMPLAEIRRVLVEPESQSREHALAQHLERMEAELTRTRDVVSSLRRLLGAAPPGPVGHRRAPASTVLRVSARLARTDVGDWCGQTYPELYGVLARHGIDPAGAPGATYSAEFFEQDKGEVVAFVPVPADSVPADFLPADSVAADFLAAGDGRFTVLAPQRFAVAVHTGPYTDCDLTYGRLGAHVAEHDVALTDPIVEIYLVGPDQTNDANQFQTEICWPVR